MLVFDVGTAHFARTSVSHRKVFFILVCFRFGPTTVLVKGVDVISVSITWECPIAAAMRGGLVWLGVRGMALLEQV